MILKIIAIWVAVIMQFVFFNLFPVGMTGLNIMLILSLVFIFFEKTKLAIITLVLGTFLIDYISGYGYGIWPISMFISLGAIYYIKKFVPKKTDFFFSLSLALALIVFNVVFMIYCSIFNSFNLTGWWFLQLFYTLLLNTVFGYAIYKLYARYFYHKKEFSF